MQRGYWSSLLSLREEPRETLTTFVYVSCSFICRCHSLSLLPLIFVLWVYVFRLAVNISIKYRWEEMTMKSMLFSSQSENTNYDNKNNTKWQIFLVTHFGWRKWCAGIYPPKNVVSIRWRVTKMVIEKWLIRWFAWTARPKAFTSIDFNRSHSPFSLASSNAHKKKLILSGTPNDLLT